MRGEGRGHGGNSRAMRASVHSHSTYTADPHDLQQQYSHSACCQCKGYNAPRGSWHGSMKAVKLQTIVGEGDELTWKAEMEHGRSFLYVAVHEQEDVAR